MSDTVLKRLNVSDVFTIPYEANKLWSITASDFIGYGIFSQTGSYTSSVNQIDFTYSNLLYKSILANYYPEFYPKNSLSTSSYYQTVNYNVNITSTDYAVSGALRLGNGATTEKFYPTTSGSRVWAVNIPNTLYSSKIVPTTFVATINEGWIYDDGEYNLRWSGSGNYLAQSQSSLIKLNSGSLPNNLINLTVGGTVYPITSRDSNTTLHISTSLYLNSSSYTINYLTSSRESGSDLTMYNIQTDITSANTTITSTSGVSGSSTLNFVPQTPWNFTSGPIPTPPADLSGSFGGGPPYNTILTVTPSTGYFQFGTSSVNYAYIQSATGSLDVPPYSGSFSLAPGYTLLLLPSTGSTFLLNNTSQSYQPSTVVTQSSVTFNANIVNASGSINIGGNNYPITNRLSSISVEIATPLLYTSNTNFTLEYSQSALFNSSSISAGGLITVLDPKVTGSAGTILSQSSYVGNIFYEQGIGVLTNYPISITNSSSFQNIQFQNSYTLYEQNMVCRVKDYEFNASYNPTLTTGSFGFIYESASVWITSSTLPYNYTGTYYTNPDNQLKDFATASYFSPYVGSLGFYNDSNQLLAVAKMSQPVPLSNETDLTFLVKLDW